MIIHYYKEKYAPYKNKAQTFYANSKDERFFVIKNL